MTYLRDERGRFRASKFLAWGLVICTFVGLTFGTVKGIVEGDTVVYKVQEKIVEVDNLAPKVEQLKNELLDKLVKCESNGYSEADAPIIFDSNNKASIGLLQFQKATVQHYVKTLRGTEITAKEATLLALDAKQSRQLASEILFGTAKGYTNWQNCATKLGLANEIVFINRLK